VIPDKACTDKHSSFPVVVLTKVITGGNLILKILIRVLTGVHSKAFDVLTGDMLTVVCSVGGG